MGFNELIGKLFGNKNTRDMREIQPWVEKVKKAYPAIEKLDNDGLRAKTQEFKELIKLSATEENAKIVELKAKVETTEKLVIKLSIMVNPIPLRSAPPVVNAGLLAASRSGIPTPLSLITISRM